MKLPPEIRRLVYEFTLTDIKQLVVVGRWNDKGPGFIYPNLDYSKLNMGIMGVNHHWQ